MDDRLSPHHSKLSQMDDNNLLTVRVETMLRPSSEHGKKTQLQLVSLGLFLFISTVLIARIHYTSSSFLHQLASEATTCCCTGSKISIIGCIFQKISPHFSNEIFILDCSDQTREADWILNRLLALICFLDTTTPLAASLTLSTSLPLL